MTVQIRRFECILHCNSNRLIVVGFYECWPVLRYADNPVLFGDDHSRIHHILETLDLIQQHGLSCLRALMDFCRHGAVVCPSPASSLGSITRCAQVDYQTCRRSGMLQVSWLALTLPCCSHSNTISMPCSLQTCLSLSAYTDNPPLEWITDVCVWDVQGWLWRTPYL